MPCDRDKIYDSATQTCKKIEQNRSRQTRLKTYADVAQPEVGYVYDPAGQLVPIPPGGYRTVGTAQTWGGTVAAGVTLNAVAAGATRSDGALTSVQVPSLNGIAATGTNAYAISAGSAVVMDFGTDPLTGMSWGRWQGGQLTQTDLATGSSSTLSQGLGSTHWFVSPVQTQAVVLPLTGVVSYTLAGSTTPTDATGAMGALNAARLTANFTNATVDVGLNVTLPNTGGQSRPPFAVIDASALGIPILPGANFRTTDLVTQCPFCTGATSGVLEGQFTGPGGSGAGLAYGLRNGAQSVSGVVTFRKLGN